MNHDQNRAHRRDLHRVRAIAALSALLESVKLLPVIDGVVVVVEWLGLKTALPVAWAWIDLAADGQLTLKNAAAAVATDTWPALLARSFGGGMGAAAVALDAATDAGSAILPAPFDGFDVPPMLVDAGIAVMAHRALKKTAPGEHDVGGPALDAPALAGK